MQNIFILIASDITDFSGQKLTAEEATMNRLTNVIWPLYSGTRNRKMIKDGDKCLFYLAGANAKAQSFIGEADVVAIKRPKNITVLLSKLAVEQPPVEIIIFGAFSLYDEPKPIRPILDELSFIPKNRSRWGAAMQGGCRRISKEDYEVIATS
jgi:hypothetical protein